MGNVFAAASTRRPLALGRRLRDLLVALCLGDWITRRWPDVRYERKQTLPIGDVALGRGASPAKLRGLELVSEELRFTLQLLDHRVAPRELGLLVLQLTPQTRVFFEDLGEAGHGSF